MKKRSLRFEALGSRNLMTGDLVGFGFGGWGDPDFTANGWGEVDFTDGGWGDPGIYVDSADATDVAFGFGGWGDPGF